MLRRSPSSRYNRKSGAKVRISEQKTKRFWNFLSVSVIKRKRPTMWPTSSLRLFNCFSLPVQLILWLRHDLLRQCNAYTPFYYYCHKEKPQSCSCYPPLRTSLKYPYYVTRTCTLQIELFFLIFCKFSDIVT